MLRGVIAHIEALDRADWESLADSIRPSDTEELTQALTRFVQSATGPGRARTRARYSLFLETSSSPDLREPLARSRARIAEWGVHWLRGLGSPQPEGRSRVLLNYLDGLILHHITMPESDVDIAVGVQSVIAGLISQ